MAVGAPFSQISTLAKYFCFLCSVYNLILYRLYMNVLCLVNLLVYFIFTHGVKSRVSISLLGKIEKVRRAEALGVDSEQSFPMLW